MKPVLRSCEVAPALAAAMQTTAPTQSATGEYHSPVQPRATKIVQVRISVAMVIPETGFDDEPIRPTILDETVTKKNPKMTTRIEATKLPCVGIAGAMARNSANSTVPMSTMLRGISRSVRLWPPAAPLALKSLMLSRNDETIVGIVRASVMRPAASTAPAPVYRM